MKIIQLRAMGKINLGLDVVRRREDGYHEVRMVMQMVNLYDRIKITKIRRPKIYISSNLPFLPINENNIAYQAAKLLMDEFKLRSGVYIEIEKHIPVAAGMAGGSSDAASVLHGINRLFHLNLSKSQLMERGVKLGADVPFCISRRTSLCEGIGEIITPLQSIPDCYILIAKPGFSVSTKHVYENLNIDAISTHPDIDGLVNAVSRQDIHGIAGHMANVLETVTAVEYPDIEKIKDLMCQNGALNAMMSGSGPTIFGIFKHKKTARIAYEELRKEANVRNVFLTRPYPHSNQMRKNKGEKYDKKLEHEY